MTEVKVPVPLMLTLLNVLCQLDNVMDEADLVLPQGTLKYDEVDTLISTLHVGLRNEGVDDVKVDEAMIVG